MSDKQETPATPDTPPEPTPDPPAPDPTPDLPSTPTTAELKTHLDSLEAKLDQLLAMGASPKETEAVAEEIVETEAILETPAATGDQLDPATTDPGQASDPARSGDPTANSSPEGTEPETPSRRKRKRGFGKRSRT